MAFKIKPIELVFIALCASLTVVCSFIYLPFGSVNFTLQVFAIAFSGFLLGAKKGTLATFVYVLLGLIGIPVFSGFQGGISALFNITGGFILGFVPLAFFSGIKKHPLLFSFLGLLICHVFGVTVFCLVTGRGVLEGIILASLPYILKDVVLVLLAYKTSGVIKKRMNYINKENK